MSTQQTDTSIRWVGWVYESGSWHRVCQSADLSTCSKRLGEIGRERGVDTCHLALSGGKPPTYTPSPLKKRRV